MLILASASPRRRELLALSGYEFSVIPSEADETVKGWLSVESLTEELALRKARDIAKQYPSDVVIGSDTVVAIDGEILGKPKDKADAKRMLRRLSGRVHTVATGVAIISETGEEIFSKSAKVEFYELSEEEIKAYVESGESEGKAGAYAIQGLGALLIKGIEGDFYTVMGLPIAALCRRLRKYEPLILG